MIREEAFQDGGHTWGYSRVGEAMKGTFRDGGGCGGNVLGWRRLWRGYSRVEEALQGIF